MITRLPFGLGMVLKSVEAIFYEEMIFVKDFLTHDLCKAGFAISTTLCDVLDKIYNEKRIQIFTEEPDHDFWRLKCDFRGKFANLVRSLKRYDEGWLLSQEELYTLKDYVYRTKKYYIPHMRQVFTYIQNYLPVYASRLAKKSKIVKYDELMKFQADFLYGLMLPVHEIMFPEKDFRSKLGSLQYYKKIINS